MSHLPAGLQRHTGAPLTVPAKPDPLQNFPWLHTGVLLVLLNAAMASVGICK